MQTLLNIVIPGSKDKPIALDVFYQDNTKKRPLVIFVHGFKGFKDWGHFNFLAKTFAQAGYVFLKFNFSYNGTTLQNPTDFADLEAFGNNNYITELDDLKLVIDWALSDNSLYEKINKEEVYLIGHSRGGGICVLKASEDSRVKKLVTWASVSDFISRNKQTTICEWKEKGVLYIYNTRTHQNMPLFYQLYETTMANVNRLSILKNARKIKSPALIIHGTKDEAVSKNDAIELHNAIPRSELMIIEGAGHTFDVKHPFVGEEIPFNAIKVIQATITFLGAGSAA